MYSGHRDVAWYILVCTQDKTVYYLFSRTRPFYMLAYNYINISRDKKYFAISKPQGFFYYIIQRATKYNKMLHCCCDVEAESPRQFPFLLLIHSFAIFCMLMQSGIHKQSKNLSIILLLYFSIFFCSTAQHKVLVGSIQYLSLIHI